MVDNCFSIRCKYVRLKQQNESLAEMPTADIYTNEHLKYILIMVFYIYLKTNVQRDNKIEIFNIKIIQRIF